MPSKVNFTQAIIRGVDFELDKKTNQVHVNINMATSWTAKVREKMKWGEIPEWEIGPTILKGELVGTEMILRPSDDKLGAEEFTLAIHAVSDFKAYRRKEGEGSKTVLQFTIRTRADDAEALTGAYLRRVGQIGGELSVSYERQMELGETTQPEE